MDILRCEKVGKRLDGVQALAEVSLQFQAVGIVAIIGPNGAGKTTLLNVLTGFGRADTGRCFLGEHETTRLAADQIARLGVTRTFQDVRVISQMSVMDNVMLARPRQQGERLLQALLRRSVLQEEARNREEAMRLLTFMGLECAAAVAARELSYGQQKLLTLACCVATEARILLLDEPVAGVGAEMVGQTLGLLRELHQKGKLIVFIEHDIQAVREVADWVIVMDEGRIVAQGVTHDVLERPEIIEAYIA